MAKERHPNHSPTQRQILGNFSFPFGKDSCVCCGELQIEERKGTREPENKQTNKQERQNKDSCIEIPFLLKK